MLLFSEDVDSHPWIYCISLKKTNFSKREANINQLDIAVYFSYEKKDLKTWLSWLIYHDIQ